MGKWLHGLILCGLFASQRSRSWGGGGAGVPLLRAAPKSHVSLLGGDERWTGEQSGQHVVQPRWASASWQPPQLHPKPPRIHFFLLIPCKAKAESICWGSLSM